MEAAQTLDPNDPYSKDAVLKMLKLADYVLPDDRPGWIPPDILYVWDTCPYAYQTEKELMPAGGLHNEILTYIAEILRYFFKTRGLRFLADTFMLYRDSQGIKQRVAPDFMVIPFRHPPPSAYDLETEPAPLAIMEITSPKSHMKDMYEMEHSLAANTLLTSASAASSWALALFCFCAIHRRQLTDQ